MVEEVNMAAAARHQATVVLGFLDKIAQGRRQKEKIVRMEPHGGCGVYKLRDKALHSFPSQELMPVAHLPVENPDKKLLVGIQLYPQVSDTGRPPRIHSAVQIDPPRQALLKPAIKLKLRTANIQRLIVQRTICPRSMGKMPTSNPSGPKP